MDSRTNSPATVGQGEARGRVALGFAACLSKNHNIKEIRRANEILGEAGFKVSAVQNHFSLLYRSSEKGGVLDYCKENCIEFWAYMVLEQGALSGKYNKENPLPAESDRGKKYRSATKETLGSSKNPVLEQLEALTGEMTAIVRELQHRFTIINFMVKDIDAALDQTGADIEDNVQFVLARKQKCRVIITNNSRTTAFCWAHRLSSPRRSGR